MTNFEQVESTSKKQAFWLRALIGCLWMLTCYHNRRSHHLYWAYDFLLLFYLKKVDGLWLQQCTFNWEALVCMILTIWPPRLLSVPHLPILSAPIACHTPPPIAISSFQMLLYVHK